MMKKSSFNNGVVIFYIPYYRRYKELEEYKNKHDVKCMVLINEDRKDIFVESSESLVKSVLDLAKEDKKVPVIVEYLEKDETYKHMEKKLQLSFFRGGAEEMENFKEVLLEKIYSLVG